MPRVFEGAPFPLRTVLITAVDERPAAFGFVAADECGIDKAVVMTRTRRNDVRLRFIKSSWPRGFLSVRGVENLLNGGCP
jgi:hypothetical protein